MKNDWVIVTVSVDPSILEELSGHFFEMGSEGIEEKDSCFNLYFSAGNWGPEKKEELLRLLGKKGISTEVINISRIENQNWNENWKENFKTFHLTSKIVIQPDWENYQANSDETVITIAPKMAFGTGHHETTKLILKQLQEEIQPGISILDAGTGSGILAIFAALCGAGKIVAFDNDPQAIENAIENCSLNNVSGKIDLLIAGIDGIKIEPYDLIIANINKNVLLESANNFSKFARSTTKLILSGLLATDEEDIKNNYESFGWVFNKIDQINEWISLQFVYSN